MTCLFVGLVSFIIFQNMEPEIESEAPVAQTDDTPVIRVFDKNISGQAFDDAVAETIMAKTGVKIELMDATSNPTDKLQMMLSNGQLPDIILMEQGEMVNQYIESRAFIPLDDLIEEYGDQIKEMYGDILDKSRYENGHIYWLANWYGKDTDASAGVLMRKDYLIELVGEERANSTEPFTLSEYTQLLHDFQKRHIKINGVRSIPLDIDSDLDLYEATLKGIFGLKTYEIDEKGRLHYLPASERFKEVLLYLNALYRDGCLCKQWVIDRNAKWESDLKSGAVFSTWAAYWDTDAVNLKLKGEYGKDAQFYCYKVVADDLKASETTYNGRNSLGWDAIGITRSCENPEAAMKVLNYLASEEGQYLLLWGIEGESWDMVNGKHVPKASFLEQWRKMPTSTQMATGVRRWKWTIKNGDGSDGTPYDLTTKYTVSELGAYANERIDDTDYWDMAEYSGLEPTSDSKLSFKWQQIEDLYEQYYTKIICAGTEEEAKQLYKKMKSDMKIVGLEECESYINQRYKERMKEWTTK